MNTLKIFQKGFNYRQDGPGNRLVYHLQGCNFSCPWCSNPEGIDAVGVFIIKGKNISDKVCPHNAIKNGGVNRFICKSCISRECLTTGRNQGIVFSYKEYNIDDLVDEGVQSSNLFYENGGVTLSGGEPTLQFDAVKTLLMKLKGEKINTAIETNGSHSKLSELLPFIDTLIFEIKHYDDNTHKKAIGTSNKTVLENLKICSSSDINLWLRITLIPEFNASLSDINAFKNLILQLNNKNLSVEFLQYHEYGKVKWEQTGKEYKMKDVKLNDELVHEYIRLFESNGIKMIKT